jgi:hypothetical protein
MAGFAVTLEAVDSPDASCALTDFKQAGQPVEIYGVHDLLAKAVVFPSKLDFPVL